MCEPSTATRGWTSPPYRACYMRTAVFPNDSTTTDPGPGDGSWIETGIWKHLFDIDWGARGALALSLPLQATTPGKPDRLLRQCACVISGAGSGLFLRDAWNADGRIPGRYYPEVRH